MLLFYFGLIKKFVQQQLKIIGKLNISQPFNFVEMSSIDLGTFSKKSSDFEGNKLVVPFGKKKLGTIAKGSFFPSFFRTFFLYGAGVNTKIFEYKRNPALRVGVTRNFECLRE